MKRLTMLLACVTFCLATSSVDAQIRYGSNPQAGKFADVNGIKLYYEIYGTGEPLLLLHGNGGSIVAFTPQIPELSKHYKVIAVDSRAQGKSTDSDQEITYALMASDVSALIDQLHLGSVYVVGWSDGGNVGLELALAHPAQVKKLVTFGANYSHLNFAAEPNDVNMSRNDPRIANTAAVIAEAKKANNPKPTPAVQKKLSDLMDKYPDITTAQLTQIKIPVLVVAGDHDAISLEHTISLYRSLPHAQLWIVPGASHFVTVEKPDIVNRAIEDFLTTPYGDLVTYYWMRMIQ